MRRSSTSTVTVAVVHPLIVYAASRGVPPPVFIERFGLDPEVLGDVDGRLPHPVVGRIWDELPALCDDPDVALHAAGLVASADSTLLSLIFTASPTLGAGLQRLLRFERVQHGEAVFELRIDGDTFDIEVHEGRATLPPPPPTVVFGLVGLLGLLTRAAKRPIPVLGAWLRHPEPRDRAPYDARFGVTVEFGAARDRLRMSTEILDWPHPEASARILHVAETHARSVEQTLPSPSTWLDGVREAVERLLPDGDATVERVARALDMAPRTLQRRLERENTSLRDVVDEVRRSTAHEHIERSSMSLAEIAFRLGFSEQSAFHRAFVRWTGRTPGEHRQASRAGRGPACPVAKGDT